MSYTYPIVREYYESGGTIRRRFSSKSNDKKKRSPTPYYVYKVDAPGVVTRGQIDDMVNTMYILATGPASRARAYDRFMKGVGVQAELALTSLDSQKSFQMIARRCGQLLKMIRDLKKGRLPIQKRSRAAKRKGAPGKSLADTWLEYTFGWVPLVEDIGSAIEVLQSSPPISRTKGRGGVNQKLFSSERAMEGYTVLGHSSLQYSAQVVVTNPNLRLASQLGFTNPAAVAWDAVPFSFVVDWFLPVGKFLSQFDNLAGLELKDPCTNVRAQVSGGIYWLYGPVQRGPGRGTGFWRTLGSIPTPGLLDRVRIPDASLWRAATSVALVIQQLSSLR